jgi:hypothetical protein
MYRRWQGAQEVRLLAKNITQCAQVIESDVDNLLATVLSDSDCFEVLFNLNILIYLNFIHLSLTPDFMSGIINLNHAVAKKPKPFMSMILSVNNSSKCSA